MICNFSNVDFVYFAVVCLALKFLLCLNGFSLHSFGLVT